ncbi:MAG: right-handed parallel beta-helix repeat-containing protein, partial [Thermoguttaceae bacterium]
VNNSTLIVENSYFDGNRAPYGSGGAVSIQNYSNITVSNTVFTGNFGAAFGAVNLSFSTGTFTNCEFLDNTAKFYAAALGVDNHSSANIIGGKIAGNSTTVNDGCAVYVDDTSSVNLTNVAFESNSPADLGGSGTVTTTETASAALLDNAFVELEEEIELFF